MYSYTYDKETGGILLNSSPQAFSKEPRLVFSRYLKNCKARGFGV